MVERISARRWGPTIRPAIVGEVGIAGDAKWGSGHVSGTHRKAGYMPICHALGVAGAGAVRPAAGGADGIVGIAAASEKDSAGPRKPGYWVPACWCSGYARVLDLPKFAKYDRSRADWLISDNILSAHQIIDLPSWRSELGLGT